MTQRSPERDPVLEEFSRVAGQYDSRWSFYVEATTRETTSRLSVRPTDRVLDVGCGTGELLVQLAHTHPQARLVGVDPVSEMLAVARRKLPPTVELRKGWATRLPCEDRSFDVVISCNMFHYIRQPHAALREMNRVLVPGGQCVITDWCDDYLACRLCDWYLRLFNAAHFKVYSKHDCLQLLSEAGYPEARIERYRISWLWGLMTASVAKEAV